MTLAHQYLHQLDEAMRHAILGNVGTIAAFPVGPEDAALLEKHFFPPFDRSDLVDHEKHRLYLRLAIDGKTSLPFSAMVREPFDGAPTFGLHPRRGMVAGEREDAFS